MIAIVDYDAGNTCSVMNALRKLNVDFVLTESADELLRADKVILPGVGHAMAAMEALNRKDLVHTLKSIRNPFLGICLGMQLMCQDSEEGPVQCLGLIPATVKKFETTGADDGFKIPHMGWNTVATKPDSLFEDMNDPYMYFVHSYYVPSGDYCIGDAHYGIDFAAAIRKDNFAGVQFHPEKSSQAGSQLLKNFLES